MQNNIVWVNVSLVKRLVWMVDIIAMKEKEKIEQNTQREILEF